MLPHLTPPDATTRRWITAPADWDGLYQATCPCGRLVWWNAYLNRPLCICSKATTRRPRRPRPPKEPCR